MKRIKESNYIALRDAIEMFESEVNLIPLSYQIDYAECDDFVFKFDLNYLISILESEQDYKKEIILNRLTRLLNSTSRLIKEIKRN